MNDETTPKSPSESDIETPASEAAPEPDAPVAGGSRASRWGFAVVAAIALVALFWPRSEDDSRINLESVRRPGKGAAAPVGMLIDAGGRPATLGTRMAPVTLIHFWATWCPPCIPEVPSILRLADEHAGNHDFSLVMIAVQDEVEKVRTFLGSRTDESLFDHDWKVTHSYGTKKVPETHLVIRGELVESFIGATDWDDREIRQRIAEALASVQEQEG